MIVRELYEELERLMTQNARLAGVEVLIEYPSCEPLDEATDIILGVYTITEHFPCQFEQHCHDEEVTRVIISGVREKGKQ